MLFRSIGAMSVDSMLRDLAKTLDEFEPRGIDRTANAFENISTTVSDLIKKVPLLGGAVEALESGYYAFVRAVTGSRDMLDPGQVADQQKAIEDRRRFTESAQGAQDMIRELEYQEQLYRATTDERRKQLELEHELQKALEVTNKMEEGPQRDIMREAIENRVRSVALEREKAEARKKAEELQREAAEASEQQAEKIQQEIERQQQQLQTAKQQAAAEMDSLYHANNVQGIGTAVGSVRMAGAIDYSSKGMATSLEKIREIEKEIAENTRNLKTLRPQ